MPTLPLYDPAPPHPDGWHRVTAPGGYEAWHLDAEDEARTSRILVTFAQGSPFDGEYRRLYAAFLRRPTTLLPPTPADFPSVSFLLWIGGRAVARFAYRYTPTTFDASPAAPDVRIGPHRLLPGANGTLTLNIAEVPVDGAAARASAELWFTPTLFVPPLQRRFPSRAAAGADHFWVIANPLCAVTGVVRLRDSNTATQREVHFTGRGFHDHRYGTAPLFTGCNVGWLRGRLLGQNQVDIFQAFGSTGGEHCVLRADASGVHEIAPPDGAITFDSPAEVRLGTETVLGSPIEVDINPFAVVRAYELCRNGRTEGVALVESARHGFTFPKDAGDFVEAPEG